MIIPTICGTEKRESTLQQLKHFRALLWKAVASGSALVLVSSWYDGSAGTDRNDDRSTGWPLRAGGSGPQSDAKTVRRAAPVAQSDVRRQGHEGTRQCLGKIVLFWLYFDVSFYVEAVLVDVIWVLLYLFSGFILGKNPIEE